MREKHYVLDTNVLIQDPNAIFNFEDNYVVLTNTTIEELDNLKTHKGETGYCARIVSKKLDDLRKLGNLKEGIDLPNGGRLYIESNKDSTLLPDEWDEHKADNEILKGALYVSKEYSSTVLVTKDTIMRIKADSIGLVSQDYKSEMVDDEYLTYTGRRTIKVSDECIDFLLSNDECIGESEPHSEEIPFGLLKDNEFVQIVGTSSEHMLHGRYNKQLKAIAPLFYASMQPFGVKAKGVGQLYAIEALMQPAKDLPLVILKGPAGSAKTFLAMACGLEQTYNSPTYRKMLITRANVSFDNDIGALPGTEEEKVNPLLRGCLDNLELLVDEKGVREGEKEEYLKDKVYELFDRGIIDIQALAFLRGRSVTRQFVVIDEAQNTTPNQMLGILTRAGAGTKVVICGDLDQIDNPHLDRHTNGLAFALEKMTGSPLCAVVGFDESECTRSPLAMEASKRMGKGNNGRTEIQ